MSRIWTVGRLAKRFGLSRSTLLYYDSIGLLRPMDRSSGDYRRYDGAGVERLERILRFRDAGVPLADIKRILDSPSSNASSVLERRFAELDREIAALRGQQHQVAALLKESGVLARPGITKDTWTSILTNLGFSQDDMNRWHSEFERSAPREHQLFLEYLGIPEPEIAAIRHLSSDAGAEE